MIGKTEPDPMVVASPAQDAAFPASGSGSFCAPVGAPVKDSSLSSCIPSEARVMGSDLPPSPGPQAGMCVHHELLDSPSEGDGGRVRAVCKLCGRVRYLPTGWKDAIWRQTVLRGDE